MCGSYSYFHLERHCAACLVVHFTLLTPRVYTCVCLCLCTCCSTVIWDSFIICGCYATQVPTRQRGHTSSYFQDRLWDTMSHPEFYPTLPREALKICHAWQQPYISWGSLCYVSGSLAESGCSFHMIYSLLSFFFWESCRIFSTECTTLIKVTMSLQTRTKERLIQVGYVKIVLLLCFPQS